MCYTAGCTVVILDYATNKQQHLINPERKTVTCVSWSVDGKYLVTGECGKKPCVRVWDMQDLSIIAVLSGGHKYGISCVAFAPGSKYVVSVRGEMKIVDAVPHNLVIRLGPNMT